MRPNPFALILAGSLALPALADTVEPISRYAWETEIIAGVSGLELSADGKDFVAVGDRGFWMEGTIVRDANGITGIDVGRIAPILGIDGNPVAARRVGDHSDAEGLALDPDGTAWISFERWAHVTRHDGGLDSIGIHIRDHETFYDHADNWQLEAIAISPEGDIYTFSEKPFPDGFPIYKLVDGEWTITGTLPERDLFAIVGADFDDNGDLYLLERKLVMGFWWQSRIRRIRLDGTEDRTLWTSERGDFGNLEGIALWRRNGELILTAVSDNNNQDDPTEFVDFRLVPGPNPDADTALDAADPEG